MAPEHPNELTPAHFMPVSSLDPPTLPFQERPVTKQSEVPGNILSDVRMLPIVDMLNRLKASVHMPPTLAFKDHVKECQAMVERVRAAAYPLKPPHSSSTDKVSKSDKSKLASPSPVVTISSSISSGATTSRSVFSSQDGGAEEDAGSPQVEVPSVEPARDLAAGLKAKYEAKYEGQIREALEKLKRAQAEEYDRAEAALHVQKNLLIDEHSKLNQKLAVEHQVFAPRATDPPTKYVVSQLQKAHGEQIVFDSMLDISLGFGRVPKELLSKYFKWPPPATDQA